MAIDAERIKAVASWGFLGESGEGGETQVIVDLAITIDMGVTGGKVKIKQGESETLRITARDAAGPVDLSAATLLLGVKKDKSDTAYTFSKLDAAFNKVLAAQGIVSVDLTATDTNQPEGTYVGELQCSWSTGALIDKSDDFYIQIKRAVTA